MTELALAIDAAHPAFVGHFPSRPVVPGVVLLDQSLRAIATTMAATFGIDEETIAAMICRIVSAKFLSPVGPGEALRLEVEATTRPPSAPGAPSPRYALRLFAGTSANERLAMTGSVSFDLPVSRVDSA